MPIQKLEYIEDDPNIIPKVPTTTQLPGTTTPPAVKTMENFNLDNNPAEKVMGVTGTQPPITVETNEIIASSNPDEWQGEGYIAGQTDATKKAEDQANLELLTDIETAKGTQMRAAQNVANNAGASAKDYDMLKYSNNQTIEKMGWTGGSYTDLKSMESYIKATIAADMYGQVELLKYGYKTELAKVVAAKEANLASLQHQFEQEAFQNALTVSQQTGVWINPLIENDMANLNIAEDIMEEIGAIAEDQRTDAQRQEYARATNIVNTIGQWYMSSDQPLTEQGIKALRDYFKEQNYYNDITLTALQMESLQVETENANRLANQAYSANEFEAGRVVDADGKLIVDLNSNNYDSIKNYFTENPGQWAEWVVNKFEIPIQAAFNQFKADNPESDIKTIADYIAANPDSIEAAKEYAINAGQSKFTIGGKTYNVEGTEAGGDSGSGNAGNGDTSQDQFIVDEQGNLIENPDYVPGGTGNDDDDDGDDDDDVIPPPNYYMDDALGINEQATNFLVKASNGGWIQFDKQDWTLEQIKVIASNQQLISKSPSMAVGDDLATNMTEFSNQFKQGSEQTEYTDGVTALAENGFLPDGAYINMNYGQGDPKYLWYYNGKFFEAGSVSPTGAENVVIDYNNSPTLQGIMAVYNPSSKTVDLSVATKSSDFGSFSGNTNPSSDQNLYVNNLISMARAGTLPEFSIVNMNYGFGTPSYYVYRDNAFYEVKDASRIEASAALADKVTPIITSKNIGIVTGPTGYYQSSYYKDMMIKAGIIQAPAVEEEPTGTGFNGGRKDLDELEFKESRMQLLD